MPDIYYQIHNDDGETEMTVTGKDFFEEEGFTDEYGDDPDTEGALKALADLGCEETIHPTVILNCSEQAMIDGMKQKGYNMIAYEME